MSQTVARAIEILEFVSRRPRTAAEVGEHLGVHRSTALRLLQTLTEGGLARHHADGRYGVGFRLAGLAQLALEQFDLVSVARPYLEALAERCGHTVHLAELTADRIVYADKIDGIGTVRMYSRIGAPVSLHTAGVGKAILARLPAERVARLLAGHAFDRHTATTLTTRDAFLAELGATRERGYAVDDGEFEDYVNCVAAPVRDASGQTVAAVSVTALKARADLTALRDLVPALLGTADSISKELGHRP